jgi:hypothetical protein
MLLGGALAPQKRVGDDVDELREGEDVLVGPPPGAVEDVVEEAVLGAEVEQAKDGIRQRQTLTNFPLEALQGDSLPRKEGLVRGEPMNWIGLTPEPSRSVRLARRPAGGGRGTRATPAEDSPSRPPAQAPKRTRAFTVNRPSCKTQD